jgi:acetolactate synthase I/II/III large subunit
MSDSYLVLPITDYIRREWQGRGAVSDTSGRNGIPYSQAYSQLRRKSPF